MTAAALPVALPARPRGGRRPAPPVLGRRRPAPPVLGRRRPAPPVLGRRRPAPSARPALLVAAVVAVVLAGGVGTGPAPAPAPVPVARASHVAEPGDTLWSLARRVQPTGDVRPLVDRLAAARGGAPLRAGERVALPR